MPYMWNRNNPYAYSDPSGYDVIIMIDPRSVKPLGHISMVIFDPITMAGTRYESGPVEEGSVVHAREQITIEQIKDVRTLGNYNQQTYYHRSTSAQDAAMKRFWAATKLAADAGTDLYNAFDNSCTDKVAGALDAAGVPDWQFGRVPSVTRALLDATWGRVDPKALKPVSH